VLRHGAHGTLESDGTPPDSVDVAAVCTLDRDGDAFRITTVDLHVSATGVAPDVLAAAAERAEKACPVSNALRGGVEIRLHVGTEPSVPA
jgi:osmotically inducible protein OsmC